MKALERPFMNCLMDLLMNSLSRCIASFPAILVSYQLCLGVSSAGSYFARDASYSDNYCGEDSYTRTMFLARVLVGEFTLGSSSYVRPPLKDNQNFYDSCVNSSSNPSIFVIFEKQQIYPEYLIEYIDQALAKML